MSTPLSFNVVIEENAATVVTVPQSVTNLTVVPANPFTVITVGGPPGPRGTPGTGAQVVGEVPAGAINGVNMVYTVAHPYTAGTVGMFLNGLRGVRGGDFAETPPNQITLTFAPQPGDSVLVDYFVS